MFDKLISGIIGAAMFVSSFFTAPQQVKQLNRQVADLQNQLSSQMVGGFTPLQTQKFKLAGSGVTAAAASIILQSFQTIDGRDITMSMIGSIGYGTIEPNTSKEEQISFTGVTQNADDTATLTGVTRGLLFEYPYTASSSLQKAHAGSAIFVLSNTSGFYGQYPAKSSNETITGSWAFPEPTTSSNPATKNYADGLVAAGVADGNYSTFGGFILATTSHLAAGTATSTATRYLVAPSEAFGATSSAKRIVPVTQITGKLSQGFINLAESWTFASATNFNATSTYTAKLILASTSPTQTNEAARKAYVDENVFAKRVTSSNADLVGSTATTTEQTLTTATLSANSLGNFGKLRVETFWTITPNVNGDTKIARIKLGGNTLCQADFAQTSTSSAGAYGELICDITNLGSTNSQIGLSSSAYGYSTLSASRMATSSVDTTADTSISITTQKQVAADNMTMNYFYVYYIK